MKHFLDCSCIVASFDDLQCNAISNFNGWCDLLAGEGFVFIHGKVLLLNLFAKLVFDLQIFLISCKGISVLNKVFGLFILLLFLNEDGCTSEMGSKYFWISLYSLNLTILSMLSNSSLLVFFLCKGNITFWVWFGMHLAVYCRAF